jgi:hypothetical protein
MIPTPIREGNIATPPKINPCRLLKLLRFRMSGEFVGDIHTLYCFLLAHGEPGSQSESVRRSSPVWIYATGDWEVMTNQGMSAVNSSWHTLDRASAVPGCLENCTLGEPQWHLVKLQRLLQQVLTEYAAGFAHKGKFSSCKFFGDHWHLRSGLLGEPQLFPLLVEFHDF